MSEKSDQQTETSSLSGSSVEEHGTHTSIRDLLEEYVTLGDEKKHLRKENEAYINRSRDINKRMRQVKSAIAVTMDDNEEVVGNVVIRRETKRKTPLKKSDLEVFFGGRFDDYQREFGYDETKVSVKNPKKRVRSE